MLAAAGAGAGEQGSHDAVARVEPGGEVCHCDADLDGRPVTTTGDVHEAELGLDHDVVASAVRVGPCLTVAGD
jgi:hypothetical protein